jgi:hypothetical protein
MFKHICYNPNLGLWLTFKNDENSPFWNKAKLLVSSWMQVCNMTKAKVNMLEIFSDKLGSVL